MRPGGQYTHGRESTTADVGIGGQRVAGVTAGRLVAYTAHEVRNPLAALRAMTQLMLGSEDRVPREAMMQQMLDCIDDLDKFLQQLLGLADVETTNMEAVDLVPLLDGVVRLFTVQAEQQGVHIEIRHNGTPRPVWGNEALLRHVFMNLVKNALEAMPRGGPVIITLRHHERLGTVRVSIRDRGAGIPEQFQARLFTDITATSRDNGGGVGLPFVHQVVTDIHDGRLWFRTKADVGTVFFVELPCAAAVQAAHSNEQAM